MIAKVLRPLFKADKQEKADAKKDKARARREEPEPKEESD